MVVPLENIGHPFQADATLHEKVEAQDSSSSCVVSVEQQGHVFRREFVAESHKGAAEFFVVDLPRMVYVEAVEEFAPFAEEAPKSAVC